MAERSLILSSDDRERVDAVAALVATGAAAVPALLACLGDPSWAVRRSVVAGLAQLGAPAIPGLLALLAGRGEDETRLAAAVDALAASGSDIDDELVSLAEASASAAASTAFLCDLVQVLGRRRSTRALPLLTRLTGHADDNVAVAAIEALGRIGGDAGLDALVALSSHASFFRVFPTIAVLGRSGDARGVPALLSLIDQPLYTTEVVRALGHTADARAVPALAVRFAATELECVRLVALAAVDLVERRRERIGTVDDLPAAFADAAPAAAAIRLSAALVHADASERAAIACVLGWLGGEAAIASLFRLVGDEPTVTATATAALKRLRGAVDDRLITELRASDSARRLVLLPLVGGRAAHFEVLLECLADADAGVRAAACEALARAGDARAVAGLFAHLGDVDARVAQAALGGIQSLGSADTERLTLAAARAPEPGIRRAAYRIIAYFGYPSGLDALLAGTEDADARLRETALAGLAFLEDARARAALLAARHDPVAKTRAAAVRALGQCEPVPATRAALREATADDDAWVRYYACQALGRARDEAATALLIERLGDAAGQVRIAAVEGLARLEHPDAIAALTHALGSPDADVQRAALVGLGQSQRLQALPILLATLGAGDASTRLVVVSALAVFDTPEVARALARAATDSDEGVRSAAVELLSARPGALATRLLAGLITEPGLRERIGRALASPAEGRVEGLVGALEQADGERALLLAGALARLRRPDADAALTQLLRHGPLGARRAAAEALRLLRTPLALAALRAAVMSDPDASVRRAAALALER